MQSEKGRVDKMISVSENIYIFGAHTRAQNLYAYMRELFPEKKVKGFLYDNDEPNPEKLYGIDVKTPDKVDDSDTKAQIWLAVKSIYFEEIIRKLRENLLNPVICVTPEMDNEFRNRYAEKVFAKKGMEFIKLYDLLEKAEVRQSKMPVVYMAKSIYDRQINKYTHPFYIVPVQAGAALTEKKISEIRDDTGINISAKNRQYCELTVLYWIWKNRKDSWVGLCHYRRHFILSDGEAVAIPPLGVDVVLPVPSICQPSIGENYRKRHDGEDWEHLLGLLKRSHKEFYDLAVRLWETPEYGNLYYTCNMFIMKKEILDGYCAWLFPILEEMERFGGQKSDAYQNRYPGFLAERLMTLYFTFYKDKYKIAYIDKSFLGGS